MKAKKNIIKVLFQDNHLIAINKKCGDLSQKDKTNDDSLIELIKQKLKQDANKPFNVYLGVIHRLDRPVSGVLVFAKTSKALVRMNTLFSKKEMNKTYLAVVQGKPQKKTETITNWLKKNEKQNKSYVVQEDTPNAKKAVLTYTVLAYFSNYTLLEISLETGRHHQIRSQLANLGHIIKGDVKYGFPRPNDDQSINLHAQKLTFTHPIKKEVIIIKAPLPNTKSWIPFIK